MPKMKYKQTYNLISALPPAINAYHDGDPTLPSNSPA